MELGGFFNQGSGLEHLGAFVTSLAIGLLIGVERERSADAKAGLRTFALTALLGTVLGMLAELAGSPWLLIAGLLVVGGLIVAAYRRARCDEDAGTTTQTALVLCFGFGVLVWYGYTTLAVMLAIATTMLLYFKPELHTLSRNLTREDLRSVLQFAVLSLIVLPILPHRGMGPYGALNPHQIWLMVVLISGVSLAGYVALRWVGQRHGAPLLGLFGGLVSSTATTLMYARHAQGNRAMLPVAAIVIVIANLMVLVRLAVLAAAVAPGVLPSLTPVLAGGLLLGGSATLHLWRNMQAGQEAPVPAIKNPTAIRVALGFGALYALVLLGAAWLADIAGDRGVYALAAVSGLTDVDAIFLSALRLFGMGTLSPAQVATTMVIAYLANLGFKLALVTSIGGSALTRACLPSVAAVVVGMGGALALVAWL